jgi:hypothetical protein
MGALMPSAATSTRSTQACVFAMAIASAVGARLLTHFALGDVPHVMDEIAYLFHAKLIAAGHLTAPPALPRAAFNMWFVDDRAARFGIFPPGWPVVLAIAVRVGLEHWVNPLLHLATVVIVGRAGARCGAPKTSNRNALTAAALYAASPQAVLLAASSMSHTLLALAASVVALAVATRLADDRPLPYSLTLGAGAAIGVAIVTRPLCAVAVAAPIALLLATRDRQRLAPLLATTAPFVLALGAFNHALTGSPFRFPQSAYFDEHIAPANVPFFRYGKGCNALGFGAACDNTVRNAVHTPFAAWTDAGDNLRSWALLVAGPIALLGIGLVIAQRRDELRGARRQALWLLVPSALVVGLYALYWQAGVCYGARFYHAALPALVIAVGVGIAMLGDHRKLIAAIVCALAFDAAGFVVSVRELTSWSWWGTDDRFAKLAERWSGEHERRAIVMVAFGPDDVKSPRLVAAAATTSRGAPWLLGVRALGALAQNAPKPEDGEIVFAKFHPGLVDALSSQFPGRKLWLYTAWADRSKDVLEPWDASRFSSSPHVYHMPADNFDGFRIAPPYELADPLMREATDEGWPP